MPRDVRIPSKDHLQHEIFMYSSVILSASKIDILIWFNFYQPILLSSLSTKAKGEVVTLNALKERKNEQTFHSSWLSASFVALPSASESQEETVSFEESDEDYKDDSEDQTKEEEHSKEEDHSEEHDDHSAEDDKFVTKGKFVESDGKMKHCKTHEACYDQREPQSWCILKPHQSWTQRGCFCESKNMHALSNEKVATNWNIRIAHPEKTGSVHTINNL
ncbi:Abundant larval transcript-2 protein [Dirofilaria immitis]|nr:Abundant larval transcript-2 protein [Dirofilaria immitis]